MAHGHAIERFSTRSAHAEILASSGAILRLLIRSYPWHGREGRAGGAAGPASGTLPSKVPEAKESTPGTLASRFQRPRSLHLAPWPQGSRGQGVYTWPYGPMGPYPWHGRKGRAGGLREGPGRTGARSGVGVDEPTAERLRIRLGWLPESARLGWLEWSLSTAGRACESETWPILASGRAPAGPPGARCPYE
jgi:hypothetical protein